MRALTPEDIEKLQRLIAHVNEELKASLDVIAAGNPSLYQVELLRSVVEDTLVREGFGQDWEPTDRGLDLEKLLDILGPWNFGLRSQLPAANFSIRFTGDHECDPMIAVGRIVVGDLSERFHSELTFWTRTDYETHWADSLTRLLAGEPSGVLLTDVDHYPDIAIVRRWAWYRRGDNIEWQEHMILPHMLRSAGDWLAAPPDDAESYVSRWFIPVDSVRAYLQRTHVT